MCIGVPSLVVAVDGLMATVEALGEQRDVSLILMDGPVELGDYLLIQVGNFAVEKIEPERARDALDFLAELEAEEIARAQRRLET
ncbi:MAG: HypC/HybG/HupF family hydrogenase formation chaperone [Halopseudomonas sp.]